MLGPIEEMILNEKNNPTSATTLSQLELIHRNALRLLKLVNSLLEFSSIEAGRIEASFEEIDIAKLTTELAAVFRPAVERAGKIPAIFQVKTIFYNFNQKS